MNKDSSKCNSNFMEKRKKVKQSLRMDNFKIRHFDITSETSQNLQSGQKNTGKAGETNIDNRLSDSWHAAIDQPIDDSSHTLPLQSDHPHNPQSHSTVPHPHQNQHTRHSSLPSYLLQSAQMGEVENGGAAGGLAEAEGELGERAS